MHGGRDCHRPVGSGRRAAPAKHGVRGRQPRQFPYRRADLADDYPDDDEGRFCRRA